MTYDEIAARLKEGDFDNPTWFMAVQIATDEMENMKLRELAELFHCGTSPLNETTEEEFLDWCKEEANNWELSIPAWLDETAPIDGLSRHGRKRL